MTEKEKRVKEMTTIQIFKKDLVEMRKKEVHHRKPNAELFRRIIKELKK